METQTFDNYTNPLNVLRRYFRKRHLILVYMSNSIKIQEPTTITDISEGLCMTKSHVYNGLVKLQNDRLIEKGRQVNGYFNFILTDKAERELKIITNCLNGERNVREYIEKLGNSNIRELDKQK